MTTLPGARKRRARGATRSRKPNTTVNVDDYDWAAKDGVIHGRRPMPDTATVNYYDPTNAGSVTEADQSRLYYHRPLGDGDAITYEFLYEPGQVMVHPAIDRMAFLLEPDGVKLHWMTAGGNDLSGLPADNAIDEPANRRGPSPLPLKPGQWNAVKLAVSGGRVAIELNGQAVYERAMEPTLGRQFGLFHYKDQTSAQVRNVVLKGNWPESIPDRLRTDLAAVSPSANSASDAAGPATRSSARGSSRSRPETWSPGRGRSSRPSVMPCWPTGSCRAPTIRSFASRAISRRRTRLHRPAMGAARSCARRSSW